jgi:hypothetical protein
VPCIGCSDDPLRRRLQHARRRTRLARCSTVRPSAAGAWRFWRRNGTIVGESTAENPLDHNTFIVWDHGEVDDFELRLQFKLTGSNEAEANSGIQFRSQIEPDGHVVGYQADIDLAGKWVGALYDEKGRGLLAGRGESAVIDADRSARRNSPRPDQTCCSKSASGTGTTTRSSPRETT